MELETKPEELSTSSSKKNILWVLNILQYIALAALVGSVLISMYSTEDKTALVALVGSVSVFVFLILLARQVSQEYNQAANQLEIKKKAELYLMTNNDFSAKDRITQAREKALYYCQELIEDYKRTRSQARNLYYILQLTTIVFSGVTPILVLVDKLEAGQAWLKWLPVICPAIASIVASVVTSFPFQKNWIAANEAVELLEAEQEKFVLGITPDYRCFDSPDEAQEQQKAKQAIEQFIVQVNNIHLNLLQQTSDKPKEDKSQGEQSSDGR